MKNNIEMIENILNTERRNRRGNREIRFEVNSNYYKAVSKLLSDYKRVLKENEQLITEVNSLKKENEELNKYKKESVPKSKVKEKIEELKKNLHTVEHYETVGAIHVLQELLEKEK